MLLRFIRNTTPLINKPFPIAMQLQATRTVQPVLRESPLPCAHALKPCPAASSLKRGLSALSPASPSAQSSPAQARRLAARFSSPAASRVVCRATSTPIMASSSNPKVLIPVVRNDGLLMQLQDARDQQCSHAQV